VFGDQSIIVVSDSGQLGLEVCPNVVLNDWFGYVVQYQILIGTFQSDEVETNR
jgi:hypothetical protein